MARSTSPLCSRESWSAAVETGMTLLKNHAELIALFAQLLIGGGGVGRLAMGRKKQNETSVVTKQTCLAARAVERTGDVDEPVENDEQGKS